MTTASRTMIFITFCLPVFLPFPAAAAEVPPAVARLEESFDASPAERKKIYTEVIKLNGRAMGADSLSRLARAVALFQRAMDGEDELVDLMVKAAPGLNKLQADSPDFIADFQAAAGEFESLAGVFPFCESYARAARIVAGNWRDGRAMFREAQAYGRDYPVCRFTRRMLLLSGCRLLLDGEFSAADECFQALWAESSSSAQAQDACRLVEALDGAGGLRLSPEQMLRWGIAQGLGGYSELAELIERYPASPQAERAYLQVFQIVVDGFAARTLTRNRTNADLVERLYKQFAAAFPNSPEMARALLLRAAINYRTGKKCQAIARKNDYYWRTYKNSSRHSTARTYSRRADTFFSRVSKAAQECAGSFPDSDERMGTGLLDALCLVEQDRYAEALAKLNHLTADGPSGKRAVEIASYTGLIQYHEGHYLEAVETLKKYLESGYSSFEGWQRAMLFLGKSRTVLGENDLAARTLATLGRVYPYTYYGIRARLLLHKLIENQSGMQPWFAQLPEIRLPVFPDTMSARGRLVEQSAAPWRELGFYSEAAYIYGHGLSLVPDDLLLRFRYHENFLEAGQFHRVLRGFRGPFRDFLAQGGEGLPDDFWDVAFLNPRQNIEIIRREGSRRGIPPGLITAVIRQESNFHPGAKSHAGALGLMQLLPSLARRLARGEGIGAVSSRRLYDPAVNIRLGTKFLAMNLDRYDGNIALAISSYNADPRNLPGWIERSHPAGTGEDVFDLDLFIEMIPLEETYHYNMIVLTNYWRYQELGGEQQNLFAWKLFKFSEVKSQ